MEEDNIAHARVSSSWSRELGARRKGGRGGSHSRVDNLITGFRSLPLLRVVFGVESVASSDIFERGGRAGRAGIEGWSERGWMDTIKVVFCVLNGHYLIRELVYDMKLGGA